MRRTNGWIGSSSSRKSFLPGEMRSWSFSLELAVAVHPAEPVGDLAPERAAHDLAFAEALGRVDLGADDGGDARSISSTPSGSIAAMRLPLLR